MHKNASKEFYGITLIDESTLNNLYRLVKEFLEQHFDANDKFHERYLEPKIEIELRKGEKLIPSGMEETF